MTRAYYKHLGVCLPPQFKVVAARRCQVGDFPFGCNGVVVAKCSCRFVQSTDTS